MQKRLIIFILAFLCFQVSVSHDLSDAYIWQKYDGIIRLPISSSILNLDPARDMSYEELTLFFAVYDGLFYIDHINRVRNNLAESYTVDQSYKLYTFTINQNAKFHDNSPVTSEDVITSIRSNLNRIGQKAQPYLNIESIKSISPGKIEINLKYADPDFPRKLAHPCCYVTKGSRSLMQSNYLQIFHSIGSGPFVPGNISSSTIKLTRNENYHRGRAYLGSIEFELIRNEEDSFLKFASGQLDMHRIPYKQYREALNLKTIKTFTRQCNDTIILDLDNRAFRSGLVKSMRPESILNVVMNHAGKSYKGILPSDSEGYFSTAASAQKILPTHPVTIGYYGDESLLKPIAVRIAVEWESKGLDVNVIKIDEYPDGISDAVLRIAKTFYQDDEFIWQNFRYELGKTDDTLSTNAGFALPELEEQTSLLVDSHFYPIARPYIAYAIANKIDNFRLIDGCVPDFWEMSLK
jgi:ABC-type transport system substrate-binding protein